MSNQVICSNPVTLVNPNAAKLIHQHHNYVVYGKFHVWRGRSITQLERILSLYRIGKVREYLPDGSYHLVHQNVDPKILERSYIFDDDTGDVFPFYIQVPCGHCANCIMSRQSSFVQRCMLETQLYRTYPWFVTLTYKENYYPSCGCLRVRDVQNFLKRFRINLKRMEDGRYDGQIRYAVCGEYGKSETSRAHYHLIIWNIQAFTTLDYHRVQHIIRHSWSKHINKSRQEALRAEFECGLLPRWYADELLEFDFKRELIGFVTTRTIDPKDYSKTFKYTMKYMCKPPRKQHLPFPSAKKPYIVSSRTSGIGGIGKPYLNSIRNTLDLSGRTKGFYVNKFASKVQNLYYNKWVIDSLFPSKSKLIPSNVRKSFLELSYYCNKGLPLSSFYHGLLRIFRKYYFDPFYIDDLFFKPTLTFDECLFNIGQWLHRLDLCSLESVDSEFSAAYQSQVDRDFFLFGVFSNSQPVNLRAREYKANMDIQRQISLERL